MLLALKYMTPQSFNWSRVVLRIQWLFLNNKFVNAQVMGFPGGWLLLLLRDLRKKTKDG